MIDLVRCSFPLDFECALPGILLTGWFNSPFIKLMGEVFRCV